MAAAAATDITHIMVATDSTGATDIIVATGDTVAVALAADHIIMATATARPVRTPATFRPRRQAMVRLRTCRRALTPEAVLRLPMAWCGDFNGSRGASALSASAASAGNKLRLQGN